MQGFTTCLWFNDEAEEAATYYVGIFSSMGSKNSKIGTIARYGDEGAAISGKPKGTVMTVTFELDGQHFMALNGGPQFTFSQAISFMVNCETQEEVDTLWEELSEGGKKEVCGWLKDKYGVSWQIVPTVLGELMKGGNPEGSRRVMVALLQMSKIEIEQLKQAYERK